METTRLDMLGPDGRRIAVWRSRVPGSGRGPVAVMCPGFGRQMVDLVAAALYLAINGVTVYRLDPLDHVGLSDGSILDYTPSATAASLKAVISLVHGIEAGQPVVLVAASMAARPAVRVALAGGVDRLVTVVGVVNMERTIAAMFGQQIVGLGRDELPQSVWVEDLEICPQRFFDDRRFGWWDLDRTVDELASLAVPAVAIHAAGDPWVAAEDVRHAFRPIRGRDRRVVEIRSSSHDLGQDPAAGSVALREVAAAVLHTDSPSRVPSLDDLAAAICMERSFHSAQTARQAGRSADGAPPFTADVVRPQSVPA